MRKHLGFVCWLFITALPSTGYSVVDTTWYSAEGFEPPRFHLGRLAGLDLIEGQDQWVATGAPPPFLPNQDGIVVQDSVVKDGQYAVLIDAAVQTQALEYCHIRRAVPFGVTSEEPIVDVSLDFFLTNGSTPTVQWALDIQGTILTRITMWMISDTNRILFLADTNWVDTGYDIQRERWYNVHTLMNFNTNEVHLYFDGTLIHVGSIITNWGVYGFASLKFDYPGTDRMYVDNYMVRSLTGPTDVKDLRLVPRDFSLSQNYPNPFNPITNIKYVLAKDAAVRLTVQNILGQEVTTLVNSDAQLAGYHSVPWDGTDRTGQKVTSGVYLYRLEATARDGSSHFVDMKKMVLLK